MIHPRGSLWSRWDLHFHTPASYDYEDSSVTPAQMVERLVSEGVRVVAVTDHLVIDVARIREMQRLAGDRLTVLPGIELRSDQGGEPIHYICIFPEDCDLEDLWTTLQGTLQLTPAAIQRKGGIERIYVPIEQGAQLARDHGGIVSIHAGAKSNSIESISNKEQFQQRIKFDITKQYVDLMEIGQLKDIDVHWRTIFPTTGLERPLVIGSDNHRIDNYSVKVPQWFRATPTFRGLLMVLRESRDRVWIGDRPAELARVEGDKTKYVRRLRYRRKEPTNQNDLWFDGETEFNSGLIAIIGNKGSGKSALADTLGLLGATKNSASFSFLTKSRFRHPASGFASNFDAMLTWESGESTTRNLADAIRPEEVERIKYLPQDHVERVCNELAGVGEQGFERELKSVIFSHVPEGKRLRQSTLDELVRFQTGEKQKRVDSLIKQLREASRARAVLEDQADPGARAELLEKIARKELELKAHEQSKPTPVVDPATQGSPQNPEALQRLAAAEASKKELAAKIVVNQGAASDAERRRAVAKRLLEKLNNFSKEYEVFSTSLVQDATELGIDPRNLASLQIHVEEVEKKEAEAAAILSAASIELNGSKEAPGGLKARALEVETAIAQSQAQLDAPSRAYQAYLTALSEWQAKQLIIQGNEEAPESLEGLRSTLTALDSLPTQIEAQRAKQAELAALIHSEKIGQADIYRQLYQPVQDFVDSHPLAKDKLKLEFRVELTAEDFTDRFLGLLSLNRRGSFMGTDEGRARAEALLRATDWQAADSVARFLTDVDVALHRDLREGEETPISLRHQLIKGREPQEVFDFLYGLEYARPRYVLRWEGKDLSMLSPGERGTLLLVFYLLIDKGDMPLVIDQPEGNLDNHTVAKVLVDCIKEARKRRQVFLVTHNPNLAVVCDADQVVHASLDKAKGNTVTYTSGAIEDPEVSKYLTDVLEGTRWAFGVRDAKYRVGDQ